MRAFLEKGRLRRLLEGISVQVITNDKAGLLGAARCAAATRGNGSSVQK
jgi:glucokinase